MQKLQKIASYVIPNIYTRRLASYLHKGYFAPKLNKIATPLCSPLQKCIINISFCLCQVNIKHKTKICLNSLSENIIAPRILIY